MPPKKRLPEGAEQISVYLSPLEQLVLQAIRARRKDHGEDRISNSQVVSDALWNMLATMEGVSRKHIEAIMNLPRPGEGPKESKLKVFPKTEKT